MASAVDPAERAVYYAAALFLLFTSVLVLFSTVVSVLRVAEAGALGTALEVSTVLAISLSVALQSTGRPGCRE